MASLLRTDKPKQAALKLEGYTASSARLNLHRSLSFVNFAPMASEKLENLELGRNENAARIEQLPPEIERLEINSGSGEALVDAKDDSAEKGIIPNKGQSESRTSKCDTNLNDNETIQTDLQNVIDKDNIALDNKKPVGHTEDTAEHFFEASANLDNLQSDSGLYRDTSAGTDTHLPESIVEEHQVRESSGISENRKHNEESTDNSNISSKSGDTSENFGDNDQNTGDETIGSAFPDTVNDNDQTVGDEAIAGDSHISENIGDNDEIVKEAAEGSDSSGTEEEYESADEGEEIQLDAEQLKDLEESLTDEQKEELRQSAQVLKEQGNELFRCGSYKSAIKLYSRALRKCPLKFAKDRSIVYSNRAVCKLKLNDDEAAIRDCSKALDLHPYYMKALVRRAELYEKTEKFEEALADYQKVIELDPSQHNARAACMRLPDLIKERNEKLKEEMMGKLKDLGNLVLRPFGLSTSNFQMNQDPNTGGYSVNFVQNPGQ